MAQPLRGPPRRTVAVLPPALKVSFLTDAASLVSDSCPCLASYLARRALEVGKTGEAKLPKAALAGFCPRCGAKLEAQQCQPLSATQKRRLRRKVCRSSKLHEQQKKSIGISTCQACHQVTSQMLSKPPPADGRGLQGRAKAA
ncbi:hypothetical protein WJX74_008173 [Apatococcus lobatus]|uniref:Uncharacterized protein n=2 Tax=Apatococcus TaxID=904362 RepID=A0AAW1T305_9CHLO